MDWKSTVDEEAVRVLLALPLRESTKVMDAIRNLVRHPPQTANTFGQDQAGRALSAITVGRNEIVFWVDHATKEIRIVGLFSD